MKFKVIALAALMGISGMAAQANELPDGPHIVTSGTASVDAVPDIATLAIEVNVAAKDAATAKKQADERVAQYISFLELNQIAKKDISSANLRTQPDYDYQDGKSILKGYRAVRTVEVTLRQLDKLNSLLDGALKAGLNEIRSVSLGVAQPDAYKDKARKAAIDNAIHQAQELANGFNRKLGPVYSVRYHVSNYQPSPMVRMMKADAAPRLELLDGDATPIPVKLDILAITSTAKTIDYEVEVERYNKSAKRASLPQFATMMADDSTLLSGVSELDAIPPQSQVLTEQRLKYWFKLADPQTRNTFLQWAEKQPSS